MNSLMQQLFMVPEFRYGILLQREPEPEDFKDPARKERKKPKPEESLLYQVQRIFGHLQESEKRSFNARAFLPTYRDMEGETMKPNVQMDANE